MAKRADSVLVIDDDAAVRALLSRLVELYGLRAVPAANGVAGMRAFESERQRIACVLLDAVMPVMGGVATLCALRERDLDVPVFVVSGHDQAQLELDFAECLPDRFIAKPCDGATLFAAFANAGIPPVLGPGEAVRAAS